MGMASVNAVVVLVSIPGDMVTIVNAKMTAVLVTVTTSSVMAMEIVAGERYHFEHILDTLMQNVASSAAASVSVSKDGLEIFAIAMKVKISACLLTMERCAPVMAGVNVIR